MTTNGHEKLSKISILLPVQKHKALKRAVLEMGISIQKLLESAVNETVEGKRTVESTGMSDESRNSHADEQYGKSTAYWHALLEAVLTSGNESASVAIQRNLEVFAFTVSLAGKQTPEEFRRTLDTFMKANAPTTAAHRRTKRAS